MKNVLWFVLGIAGGFVVAHFMNKDPRGHQVLAEVDARITEFTDRIGEAYREQEARLADIVDSAKDAASDAVDSAKDAASGALDSAKDAVAEAVDTVSDAARKLAD
ncbi:ATPase [Microbacterium fluvii]|uniref:ATPase n=1 Tax=Microbacterium fluvii TaxID=415215 RepID=A0ABW2HBB5_9MICO|nr:perilipin family protein [Microbacterium fluvii]MCU4672013.1 perilipin family protein [Microbacterium fluvii]